MSEPGRADPTSRGSGTRTTVPQLLQDIVDNPLDPGYAAAAARRSRAEHPADRPHPLTSAAAALGALVIGVVLVVAYQYAHRGAPAAKKVHDRLVERVRGAQRETDALGDRAASLERQLAAAQARALPQGASDGLASAQLVAGLTAVRGPGMTVELADPKAATTTSPVGRGGSVPIGSTTTLTDRDVRSVVNELWHDGAEAIAVNGVRLTPTSAIRFAGQAVLVDLQPITSPYRIEAIGDRDALAVNFAQSGVASRYQTLEGVQGIGFRFADSAELALPAGTGTTLHHAHQTSGRHR